MNIQALLTDRKTREDLKDKIEVVMAVVVLTGFIYKKVKKPNDGYTDITSFDQEKS